MIKNLLKKLTKPAHLEYNLMINNNITPYWSKREYSNFASEAFMKNVVAHRAIKIIAESATSVPWQVFEVKSSHKNLLLDHPLLHLLNKPNPNFAGAEFFENIYAYKLISGNAFILAVGQDNEPPSELHLLRPDRVTVVPGENSIVAGYIYQIENDKQFFPVDPVTGKARILHLRNFHPLDDWYGLSPIEAASYSIDQHNQASIWNQAMLQNGARPSGALVFTDSASLSEPQFERLKAQMSEMYAGAVNAGRPLILDGGLDWKEMGLSPVDMDFIESKNSCAREIALALGVPPQLLGIPGDNTYSNMQEARLALWEETILPMLDHVKDALNNWLVTFFGENLIIGYDQDSISALSERREQLWNKLENASFMTINEKRAMLGLSPIKNGDDIQYQ